jgi:hypothetical protein
MSQDKRAALFEYFKAINAPKWVSNGQRLFDTLRDYPEDKVDAMYARMLEYKARAEAKKKEQEIPMYKRWKMPLIMLLIWGGFWHHSCLRTKRLHSPTYAERVHRGQLF